MSRRAWLPFMILCAVVLLFAGCSKDRTATGYVHRLETEEEPNRLLELYEEFLARYPEHATNPAFEKPLGEARERLAALLASKTIARYTPFIEEYLLDHPQSEHMSGLVRRVAEEKTLANLESTLSARQMSPLPKEIRTEIVRLVVESHAESRSHEALGRALDLLALDFPGLQHFLSLSNALRPLFEEKGQVQYAEILMAAGDFARFGCASPELAVTLYSEAVSRDPSLHEEAAFRSAIACARTDTPIRVNDATVSFDDLLA
ncbi:MAG TPA: hypothetical protein PKH07_13035, partial [bacterium]|nr:hypothetical protein [bacterium]